jgi:hypothetical protein
MLAQVAGMIETVGLQARTAGRNCGQCRLSQNIGGDVLDRRIDDLVNEAELLYSPEATREMTSRRVISGSTMASRPRRP